MTDSPNQWDVTLLGSDEEIRRDLTERWEWGDLGGDAIEGALVAFRVIREQTMAELDEDGDTIVMGLCEFNFPLTVKLSQLVDYLIDICARGYGDGRRIYDEEAPAAIRWAERFEAAARKIREALAE